MICCALLAALIGLILPVVMPWRLMQASPMAWRPGNAAGARRRFSLAARLRGFGHAFAGIGFMIRNEHNAWIHLAAGTGAVAAGIGLRISAADWRWIVLAIALVLAAEAMNTAIEQVCNVASPAQNAMIGAAKDVAAGAVLMTAVAAAMIGIATFAPYLVSEGPDLPRFQSGWCHAPDE